MPSLGEAEVPTAFFIRALTLRNAMPPWIDQVQAPAGTMAHVIKNS